MPLPLLRIVGWNIRAGGGVRAEVIAAQLAAWRADVVALSEFRGTPASARLAATLADHGLAHQAHTVNTRDLAQNRLLVASRWPLTSVDLPRRPTPLGRWLPVRVEAAQPFVVGALHGPLWQSGRKRRWRWTLLQIARRWDGAPAILIGDTNTGRPLVDEQSAVFGPNDTRWFDALERAGWRDAWRALHPAARGYTWYSPNAGNGFRLDEAFVNRSLWPRVFRVRHAWGRASSKPGRDALSDHAAVIVELRT